MSGFGQVKVLTNAVDQIYHNGHFEKKHKNKHQNLYDVLVNTNIIPFKVLSKKNYIFASYNYVSLLVDPLSPNLQLLTYCKPNIKIFLKKIINFKLI